METPITWQVAETPREVIKITPDGRLYVLGRWILLTDAERAAVGDLCRKMHAGPPLTFRADDPPALSWSSDLDS